MEFFDRDYEQVKLTLVKKESKEKKVLTLDPAILARGSEYFASRLAPDSKWTDRIENVDSLELAEGFLRCLYDINHLQLLEERAGDPAFWDFSFTMIDLSNRWQSLPICKVVCERTWEKKGALSLRTKSNGEPNDAFKTFFGVLAVFKHQFIWPALEPFLHKLYLIRCPGERWVNEPSRGDVDKGPLEYALPPSLRSDFLVVYLKSEITSRRSAHAFLILFINCIIDERNDDNLKEYARVLEGTTFASNVLKALKERTPFYAKLLQKIPKGATFYLIYKRLLANFMRANGGPRPTRKRRREADADDDDDD